MHITLYLEQVKGQDVDHYRVVNQMEESNREAIHQYEEQRESNADMKPATAYHDNSRQMSEDDLALVSTLSGITTWKMRTRFPGLVSVNRDDCTVNAYITQRDFVMGRPQKIKFGKFLRKTCAFDDTAINNMANELKSLILLMDDAKLSLANGADEIVHVYENGPNSCMSGGGFDSHVHPASVYDSEDISCAFVQLGDRIVARALINNKDNLFSTTYGNDALLLPLLKEAGYQSGNLDGCRIRRIRTLDGNAFVMPYIDGCDYVEDVPGDYFIIDGMGGDVYCANTNGLSQEGDACENCGHISDDMYWIEDIGHVCDHDCAAEMDYHIPFDDEYGEFIHEDGLHFCVTNDRWYRSTEDLAYVEHEWYLLDDDLIVWSALDDEYYRRSDCTYIEHRETWVIDHEVEEYLDEYPEPA